MRTTCGLFLKLEGWLMNRVVDVLIECSSNNAHRARERRNQDDAHVERNSARKHEQEEGAM